MIKQSFEIPIYPGMLVVAVGETLEEVVIKMGYKADVSECAAIATDRVKRGRKEFAIFMSKDTTISQIVHESKHIVNKVFEYIGQRLDVVNDEAECYFLQWVFEKAHSTHKKYDTVRIPTKD